MVSNSTEVGINIRKIIRLPKTPLRTVVLRPPVSFLKNALSLRVKDVCVHFRWSVLSLIRRSTTSLNDLSVTTQSWARSIRGCLLGVAQLLLGEFATRLDHSENNAQAPINFGPTSRSFERLLTTPVNNSRYMAKAIDRSGMHEKAETAGSNPHGHTQTYLWSPSNYYIFRISLGMLSFLYNFAGYLVGAYHWAEYYKCSAISPWPPLAISVESTKSRTVSLTSTALLPDIDHFPYV